MVDQNKHMKKVIPLAVIAIVLVGISGFIALDYRSLMVWVAQPPRLHGKFHVNVLIKRKDLRVIPRILDQVNKKYPENPGDGHAVLTQSWWSSGCVQIMRSVSDYSAQDIADFLKKEYGDQVDEIRVVVESPTST